MRDRAKVGNPSTRSEKKYLEGTRPESCIICGFNFDSHEWITPAGWIAKGTKASMGHDFTPLIGLPIRHPRFISKPNRDGMVETDSGVKEGLS